VETILVSLVSLALIIIASVTMTISTMQSSNKVADSWKNMETQSANISRTDIAAIAPAHYNGGAIDLTVKNDGQTNLSDFARWDVIVQYQSGNVTYLTFNAGYPPGANQWAVKGIYSSAGTPEIFDHGVLNPGEQMIVTISLNPEVISGQACRITISTSNGVKSQAELTRD
jgi:hypothetical protein